MTSEKCSVEVVWVNSWKSRRTHRAGVHLVHDVTSAQSTNRHEDVSIVPEQPSRTTQIATDLSLELKQKVITCLSGNQDVFAWSTKEVTGVSSTIMEHQLSIDPEIIHVQQRKRHFRLKKGKIFRVEIIKLLEADHIR